jgi:hypothetical protein
MAAVSIKQLEYLMVFVRMFADHFRISEKQAFNYLDRHKGLAFVRNHYDVMHTLDFDYAIQDVQEVCQSNGGRL